MFKSLMEIVAALVQGAGESQTLIEKLATNQQKQTANVQGLVEYLKGAAMAKANTGPKPKSTVVASTRLINYQILQGVALAINRCRETSVKLEESIQKFKDHVNHCDNRSSATVLISDMRAFVLPHEHLMTMLIIQQNDALAILNDACRHILESSTQKE